MKAFFRLLLIGVLSLVLGGMVQEITHVTLGQSKELPNLSLFYGFIIFAIIMITQAIIRYRNRKDED